MPEYGASKGCPSLLSVAVIKKKNKYFDQNPIGEERVCLAYGSRSQSITEERENSRQEPGSRNHGRMMLTGLLHQLILSQLLYTTQGLSV